MYNGNSTYPYYDFKNLSGEPINFETQYLFRGVVYKFTNRGVNSGHPFMIGEWPGDTLSEHVYGKPLGLEDGELPYTPTPHS